MCGCRNVCSLWQGREKQTLSPVDFVALTASLRGDCYFPSVGARLARLPFLEGWGWMEGSPTRSQEREARAWGRVYGAPLARLCLLGAFKSSTLLLPLGHEPPPPNLRSHLQWPGAPSQLLSGPAASHLTVSQWPEGSL